MVHIEGSCGHIYLKLRKRPYLGPGTKNEENKPTFFSQTSKVGEKKVPLFFHFSTPFLRFGHFVENYVHVPGTISQNDHNLAQKA